MSALPKDYNARKALPVYDFLTKYFPLAFLELVKVAVVGNEQHNPGEPLHWARGKSMDQLNTAVRHIMDHGMGNVYDDDPEAPREAGAFVPSTRTMHLAKAAWRLMAEIQLLCEKRDAAPVIVGTVPPVPEAPRDVVAALASLTPSAPSVKDRLSKAFEVKASLTASEAWGVVFNYCRVRGPEDSVGWDRLAGILSIPPQASVPDFSEAFFAAWDAP